MTNYIFSDSLSINLIFGTKMKKLKKGEETEFFMSRCHSWHFAIAMND
jgi:hypothetical protein